MVNLMSSVSSVYTVAIMESCLKRIKDIEVKMLRELVQDEAFKNFGEEAEEGDGAEFG